MSWITVFGTDEGASPDAARRLGAKGRSLVEMTNMGLPVPPGFIVPTEACIVAVEKGAWPDGLDGEIEAALAHLEAKLGLGFGDADKPLLVSVRPGGPLTLPGLVPTVLNLGLNDQTVEGLAVRAHDPRFAWDTYRQFVRLFGDSVLGIHYTRFDREEALVCGARRPVDLELDELKGLVRRLIEVVEEHGEPFPQDPRQQLTLTINAVYRSHASHRARYYRKLHNIPETAGTAVNIQAMVFGNLGSDSGTGRFWTRCPRTGRKHLVGEWRPQRQGEAQDTALPLEDDGEGGASLESQLPGAYASAREYAQRLEGFYRDMQEVEFTVEHGVLWVLETREARRSPAAMVQVAVDLVAEGVLTREEAIIRTDPSRLELLLRPVIHPDAQRRVIARGVDASPGAATGRVVFQSQECIEFAERGEPTILVRLDTTTGDIQGMSVAAGILAARGGQTSHAAVAARGMGKPCVVGASDVQVDLGRQLFYAGDTVVRRGDWITIDGATGEVMEGKVQMLAPDADEGAMHELLGWADERARLKVRANVDGGSDAQRARELGAVGVGLARTEHMFFQPEALAAMRRVVLAEESRSQSRALAEILPLQRTAFREILLAMDGLPVTVRLLDPPLHEFLPRPGADLSSAAEELGVRAEVVATRIAHLAEANPVLGRRGVRVGITTPAIYEIQVRALFEAAAQLVREGHQPVPEILVPLVADKAELDFVRTRITEVAETVLAEQNVQVDYRVGAVVEVPRTALLADQVAVLSDFLSFGTNDLTQLTWGMSRDDQGRFLPDYLRQGVLETSPLTVLDETGVGQLVRIGVERGRSANPRLELGACGEHAGEVAGVDFFHRVGLDYVSCSPFRVPVARLAAAQSAIRSGWTN